VTDLHVRRQRVIGQGRYPPIDPAADVARPAGIGAAAARDWGRVHEAYPGTSVKGVLGFLMTAKFRLDSTAKIIRESEKAER
jgi:hypothetical protein